MNRKHLLSLLVVAALALSLFCPAMAMDLSAYKDQLVILHTNDIHGHALTDIANGQFGYAAVAKLKKDLVEAGASVLLLDAGDAIQGTPLVNLSLGKVALEMMNESGYDAMSPGNHEFDWGLDNFLQISEVANFPILAANIVYKANEEHIFTPNVTFDMPNGMKVGVFAVDTPETITKTHPDKVRDMRMFMGDELYTCVQGQVDELKAAGCDYIVALFHLGINDESAPNRSTDVLEKVTGIDIAIDGHSHTEIDGGEMINDQMLVSTGEYFHNIGFVSFDGEKTAARLIRSKMDSYIASAINANPDVLFDPYVKDVVDSANMVVQDQLSVAFATTEVLLNGERDPGVRTEETNLGNFSADAMLWAANEALGEGTVVAAISNGGGIRATIDAGEITMNDMKTVFPYGNEVVVLTITGNELLEALESATYTTPDAIGAFPQVAGIDFTIDTTVAYEQGEMYPDSTYYAPANLGSRVSIQTVGGQPFDPEALYTITTSDFTAAGGDTYYVLRYAYQTSGYATGVALEDALINYIAKELGGVVTAEAYGATEGRITIKK